MRKVVIFGLLAVLCLGLVFAAGCTSKEKTTTSTGCASCDAAAANDDWCEDCNVGFVDGNKVKCKGCHIAKTEGGSCPTCSAN